MHLTCANPASAVATDMTGLTTQVYATCGWQDDEAV